MLVAPSPREASWTDSRFEVSEAAMTVVKGRGSKWVASIAAAGLAAAVGVVVSRQSNGAGKSQADQAEAPAAAKPAAGDTVLAAGRATPTRATGLAGNWEYQSGGLTTSCNGQKQTKDATGSTFTLHEIPGKPDHFSYSKDGCDVELQTSSNALTMREGVSCKTGSLDVTYLSASLKGDESGADIAVSGTLAGFWGKQQAACEFTSTGRVVRK